MPKNTAIISAEEKMMILDLYAKLTQAEIEIQEGNVLDADESLQALRMKRGETYSNRICDNFHRC